MGPLQLMRAFQRQAKCTLQGPSSLLLVCEICFYHLKGFMLPTLPVRKSGDQAFKHVLGLDPGRQILNTAWSVNLCGHFLFV